MIYNKSKNKIVAKDYVKCYDIVSKMRGLMFRKEIVPLIFVFNRPKICSVHTFFVKFPIDLVFLNDCFEVVEVKSDLKPFHRYTPKNPACFVLELPEYSIINSEIEIGDIVTFK